MVLPVEGADVDAFKRVAAAHADDMTAISGRGKEAGCIHHAFYANDEGKVFVVDEWDTPENFLKFFESEGPNIGPLMAEAGATPAAPQFLRKLGTADEF
jgi:hypothetical protein